MNILLLIILNINISGYLNHDNHAIYISVANIDIQAKENVLLISLKVFSDDLEDAIHNHTGVREKVVGRSDFTDLSEVIEDYINQKFKIFLDEKQVPLQVSSCENIGDTTWIYLTGETGDFKNSIRVSNLVLFEVFDTQKNIVEIEYSGEKYYYSLSKEEPEVTIQL